MTNSGLTTGGAGRLGDSLSRAFLPTHDVACVYRTTPPTLPSQLRAPFDPGQPLTHGHPAPSAYCV
jgi:hypothetical protein